MKAEPDKRGPDITQLLRAAGNGRPDACEELFRIIYDELHRLAQKQMHGEKPDQTMQATALVNEAYMKLFHGAVVDWRDRRHFFRTAARTMRAILVDHARRRNARKRAPESKRVVLDELVAVFEERAHDLLVLDEALTRLAKWDARMASIVELHFFANLTVEQTARTLDLSRRTVERELSTAKKWLRRELGTTQA